jgi:DNA-binding SARP family transcriptional activator
VEFRILGPLEVAVNGTPIALGPAKQRAVFGILLLHANEVVPTERLIDEVWGETPPPTAPKLVQGYVSQLRRALELAGGDGMLRTRAPGYSAVLDSDELDAVRFTELVSHAREQAESGAVEDAAATYKAALALWRGPVLADVAYESHACTAAERLTELRLAALAERSDCELACGRHAQLIGELESLTTEHPLHERFWEQLMLALYRSGRQSEALGAYHHARRVLVEQVGLTPGPRLQRLERAIFAHDVSLDAHAPRKPPAPPAETRVKRVMPRRRLLAGAVTLVIVVALAIVAVALPRGGGFAPLAAISPDSIGIVDPDRNALVAAIPLHTRPAAIAFGAGSLWVATKDDETLLRLDPRSHEVTHAVGLGAEPTAIAVAAGVVRTLCGTARILFQLDSDTGSVVRKITLRWKLHSRPGKALPFAPLGVALTEPFDLAAGGGAAWVAYADGVARVDGRTGTVERVEAGAGGGVGFGDRAAWSLGTLSLGAPAVIARVDPRTRTISRTVVPPDVGGEGALSGFAARANAVWAFSEHGQTVWKIDTEIRRVTAIIPLHHGPIDIAAGGKAIWTANDDGTVSRIHAGTGRLVRTIPLGHYPRVAYPVQLAVGDGTVWIAVR